MREVIGRGLRLAAAGIAFGLVGAFFSLRLLETFLFTITPGDPLTLGFIALLLLATAAAAAWIPGRRAARTDPLDALRHD
jgi:ABC-type antimicrobial peptide transport system permease subunit